MVGADSREGDRAGTAALAAALDGADSALTQAIAVLRFAVPAADLAACGVDDAADLPVGLADRALLDACTALLGRPLEQTVRCGACGGHTTLPLARADVAEHWPASAWSGPGRGAREPSYADLLACGGSPGALLVRCARGAGSYADLARADGSLAGPLRSTCAECGAPVAVDVDVMTLALAALGELRVAVDREVHLLARAYGWTPDTIDALPDARRRRLADLAAAG